MIKPTDWEEVQEYGAYVPLEKGGHKCYVVKAEEMESSTGKAMLKIAIDTAQDDTQPKFFRETFNKDNRPNKKWPAGGVVYQLLMDDEGRTNRGFKTFVSALEKSNPGFTAHWGDKFCDGLKNLRIGGIFGREEYIGNDMKAHWSTKCVQFRSIEDVENGNFTTPEDKPLSEAAEATIPTTAPAGGYYSIESEDEIPF